MNPTTRRKLILVFLFFPFFALGQVDSAKTQSLPITYGNKFIDRVAGIEIINSRASSQSGQTRIDDSDFHESNIHNSLQLIQGLVPGLGITRAGASPNQAHTLRLRGISSFEVASNTPLIVVDGIPAIDLQSIVPEDIKSITVLRDAAYSARYGIRGANGVIQIETRSNDSQNKTNISYSGFAGISSPSFALRPLSAGEYRALSIRSNQGIDYGADTDWLDEITRSGLEQMHHLGLSGGQKNMRYAVSLNYRNVEGVAENTGFEQGQFRVHLRQNTSDQKLQLQLNASALTRNEDHVPSEVFEQAYLFNPTAPIINENSTQYGGYFQRQIFNQFNPVAMINQTEQLGESLWMYGNFQAKWEPLSNLVLNAGVAGQVGESERSQYFGKEDFFAGINRNGFAGINQQRQRMQYAFVDASYDWDLRPFILTLNGGYMYQELEFAGVGASGGDFLTDAFSFNNLGAALDFSKGLGDVNSYRNNHKLAAAYGGIKLNWEDKVFLDAYLRREGSSRLGSNQQWGNFPALSLQWDILQGNSSWLNELSLRSSWGLTGNVPLSPGLSQPLLTQTGLIGSYIGPDGNFIPQTFPLVNANPNLSWEKTQQINVGFEFRAFNYRLWGAIDVYTKRSTDIILENRVQEGGTQANLTDRTYLNSGELRQNGWELSLGANLVRNESFRWDINTVLTGYPSSEIESIFDNGTDEIILYASGVGCCATPLIRFEEGGAIGQIVALQYDGIEQGRVVFKDQNGDDRIDFADDAIDAGNGLPTLEFGIQQKLSYKRWDASLFFRGFTGHSLVHQHRVGSETTSILGQYNIVSTKYFEEELTSFNPITDRQVEKADFFQLAFLTLGYSFNTEKIQWLDKLRFYFSAQNLFTLTGYTGNSSEPRLFDPISFGYPQIRPGIDRRETYPEAVSLSLGVDVKFN